MENFNKNQQKSLEYHTFFKTIKLMITDIDIYSILPDFRSDPYQNETDPKH